MTSSEHYERPLDATPEPDTDDAHTHEHGHDAQSAHTHHHAHPPLEEVRDVDSFFRRQNPMVAFIELKEGATSLSELDGVPLPIRIIDFVDGVKTSFDREIPLRALLNGMVWILAIDPTFRFTDNYRAFLQKATQDPVGYALQLGMNHYREAYRLSGERVGRSEEVLAEDAVGETASEDAAIDNELLYALLSFRGAYVLDAHEPMAAVQYARLLWTVGHEDFFNEEASHILEHVLAHDPDHALANASMGDLNAEMGHYLKATRYYQKALEHAPDPAVKEELRNSMAAIAPEAALEDATYYLTRADYAHAIEALMQAKANTTRFEVDYYLGIAYQNTGRYDAAAAAFREALEHGGKVDDVYNGLVYALNAEGELVEALKVADEGVKTFPASLRLLFNRAILHEQLGQTKKALEDVKEVLEYDDLSDELFDQAMRLREQLLAELN
ncbi:MAG: tetratricopeptide repeat protein [Peptoniphilaceae bacterium]|nr:tetratricopeptide repeat protein [Peptoniphilaceae bacterium]